MVDFTDTFIVHAFRGKVKGPVALKNRAGAEDDPERLFLIDFSGAGW